MIYIVAAVIVIGLCGWLLSSLKDLIKKHWYFIISCIITVICFVCSGGQFALRVVIGFFALWLAWKIIVLLREQIQAGHAVQLRAWLNENCLSLGKTSASTLLGGHGRVVIPSKFKSYTYPEGDTCSSIVTSFLSDCQNQLQVEIKTEIHDEMRQAGMLNEADIQHLISTYYEQATRTSFLSVLCSEAIESLIQEKVLDRPTKDKQFLHCIGVNVGTNFESEELGEELDIDI